MKHSAALLSGAPRQFALPVGFDSRSSVCAAADVIATHYAPACRNTSAICSGVTLPPCSAATFRRLLPTAGGMVIVMRQGHRSAAGWRPRLRRGRRLVVDGAAA